MCHQLKNKCIRAGCNREDHLSSDPVLCKKAKDNGNRPCKNPTDSIVDKDQRQLCKRHSGKTELYPIPKPSNTNTSVKAESSNARSAMSDEDASDSKRGREDTTAITESVAKMAVEDNAAIDSNSRESSKSATSRATESPATESKGKKPAQDLPEGYVNRYRNFAYETARPLAPEPAIWQEWRKKPPSTVAGDPDSRDGRLGLAMQTHKDRAFPLPYEPYEYYILRQLRQLGRSREEAPNFHQEFSLWMMADRQFRADDPGDQKFIRNLMMEEWHWTQTSYKLQEPV